MNAEAGADYASITQKHRQRVCRIAPSADADGSLSSRHEGHAGVGGHQRHMMMNQIQQQQMMQQQMMQQQMMGQQVQRPGMGAALGGFGASLIRGSLQTSTRSAAPPAYPYPQTPQ